MRRLALCAAPLLAAASAAGFALHRIARTPFTPYGDFGAAHLEHEVRLAVVQGWREASGGLWEHIVAVDGQYPPLLHVATLKLSSWAGYEVADVAWTGLLWLGLLAVAVATCAAAISRSALPAAAAASLVFLWPVGPAVATRYYYDLPLTAVLWSAAAVALATWDGASPADRRLAGPGRAATQLALAVPAGVVVGVLAALACGFKWTALAFAPIMVGAAFLSPVHRSGLRRRLPVRLVALLVAATTGSGILWFAASGLGPESSLATTFNDMWPGVGDALYNDDGVFQPRSALDAFAGGSDTTFFKPGLVFYPVTLVSGVLSVAFAASLAGPLVHWLRADRRGLVFVLAVVIGQGLFLALVISALDERFLLTLAPGILLAAAIGWSSLPPAPRMRWGVAVVATALLVSADFHYGDDLPVSAPLRVPMPESDDVVVRGLGLGDSWEQRGWARYDTQPHPRPQARRMIQALGAQCGFGPSVLRDAPLSASPFGDLHWLNYEHRLESLGEATMRPRIDDCASWLSSLSGLDRAEVVDRDLLLRAAVVVLDGDAVEYRVQVRGCVPEALPDGVPSTLGAPDLLELERVAPRCLQVFEDRSP